MAGKVIMSIRHGFAGSISREGDIVVVSLANLDTNPIAFGAPVFRSSDGKGVVNLANNSEATNFIGFAVRSGAKTPDMYGSDQGSYARGEMVDVLVRGSIITDCTGNGIASGKPVYLELATGKATAVAGEGTTLALTNAHFKSMKDPNSRAEVLVNTRNLI